ncbi:MAG: hypothetical protein Q9168_002927 [Polycauliona sp. 1 TL-2023]
MRETFVDRFGIDIGEVPLNKWSFSQTYVPDIIKRAVYDSEACMELFKALRYQFDKTAVTEVLRNLTEVKEKEKEKKKSLEPLEDDKDAKRTAEETLHLQEKDIIPHRENDKPLLEEEQRIQQEMEKQSLQADM